MRLSFRKNLLLFFVFFALIPTILLILTGYYIASQPISSPYEAAHESNLELIDYHNDLLFQQLVSILYNYPEDTIFSTPLEFLIRNDSLIFINTLYSDYPVQDFIKTVIKTARQKEKGFFQYQDNTWQYYRLENKFGHQVIGGICHKGRYNEITEQFSRAKIEESSQKYLKYEYLSFLFIIFVGLLILIGLTAFFFSARLSRKLSEPINQLTLASQKVATGDFKQQIEPTGPGEIRLLIENFNRMTSELDTVTAKLSQSERVAAWRHIARRFAHELKNPLQPILVSLFRIEKKLKESGEYETYRDSLTAITEEINNLTELANRFSSLAKLPPPDFKEVNLNGFLKSIAELYRDELMPYNFKLHLPDNDIKFKLDEVYFREAIHNLLLNAIDATETGNEIGIKLEENSNNIQIAIYDTGSGIEAEKLKSVRMPYFTTKAKGTGLGLAIVEKTVNELKGSVTIQSEIDKGTTITILLPKG